MLRYSYWLNYRIIFLLNFQTALFAVLIEKFENICDELVTSKAQLKIHWELHKPSSSPIAFDDNLVETILCYDHNGMYQQYV